MHFLYYEISLEPSLHASMCWRLPGAWDAMEGMLHPDVQNHSADFQKIVHRAFYRSYLHGVKFSGPSECSQNAVNSTAR
jgi:hypothetical protein